ncbi:MAG: NAD-dependent epimerase/dehydratase family protein [Candidatus Levyibacteriota bacterium]
MKNFWKDKKVLVTGGTGFIGSFVAKLLNEKGAIVTVTIFSNSNAAHLPKNIKTKKVDLTILSDCIAVTKGQEIILHFAALDGGVRFKKNHTAEIFRANLQMTMNILEASKQNKVQRILLMSSIDVYPPNNKTSVNEKDGYQHASVNHLTGYAWAKVAGEIGGTLYSEQFGLQVAIIRAGNIYGPGDYFENERARVIPNFISQALRNKDIHIMGSGEQERAFLYISDFAQAALNAVEYYAVGDPMNIAGSKYVSIKDLAKLIVKQINSRSKIILEESNIDLPKNKKISVAKAKKKLHFKEKLSLKDGLKETINYFKIKYL